MNMQLLALPEAKPVQRNYYKWTPERDARVLELCGAGALYEVVAGQMIAEFGDFVSKKAVSARANRLGLVRQTCWPKEHHDYAIELAADTRGFSMSIVADLLNEKFGTSYTRNSVIGRLNRNNVTRGPTKTAKQRVVVNRVRQSQPRPARHRISESLVQLRCAEIEPRHVSLLDLSRGECHWPYGDGPYTFCGHKAASESSYCAAHRLLSLRSPLEAA